MLRLIDSAPTGLFTMTIAVVSAVLLVGTGLDMERHFARAQAAIQFNDGDEIYRFVREDVAAGGSVGGPVEASGGTGTLTYSVTGTDAASFTINTSTGQLLVADGVSLDYESGKTTYRIVVTATDESKQTANADVVITVDNVNEPPQFDPDNIFFDSYTVQENTAANKNVGYAITAVDPEGGDVTYSLAGANATLFDVDSSSGQITTKASLNYETASSHSVSFTASDPQSNSASIDLTIEVTDDDTEAPGKPAEPAVEPSSGNGHEALKITWAAPENDGPAIKSYVVQHRIEGSASEWTPTTFAGSVLSGTITGLNTATNYAVQVRAINDEGDGPWSDPVTAETLSEPPANSRPEFDDDAVTALTIPENTSAGTAVGAPITASDSDELDTLTYSLSGTDSSLFSVGESTGQISVGAGTVLDYESPDDSGADNVYNLTVQVTDGKDAEGNTDTSADNTVAVTITVTDVNEPPGFGSSGVELEIDENSPAKTKVGGPIEASDPESDALTYSLSGSDSGLFSIAASTGQISVGSPTVLDHESPSDAGDDNVYDLTVNVSDGKDAAGNADTSIDDSINVTITVNNVDEPPHFNSEAIDLQVAENTETNIDVGDPVVASDPESGVITYSLEGANSDVFDIDAATGQIKTNEPLDHESHPEVGLSVIATDPGGLTASVEVTVTVTDVDTEAPGKPTKPSVVPDPGNEHQALKVTWTAPKNAGPAITGYVVQYRVDESGDGWTEVTVAATSANTVISGLDPTTRYEVQVRADNDEGEGSWSDSVTASTAVTPPLNSTPEFDDATLAISVAENSTAESDVGAPVTASDSDSQDELTYSLAGADSSLFSVGTSTGQISIASETTLDFESPADSDANNDYEVTLRVTDGKDADGNTDDSVDDTVTVTITVTDVNEPPEFDDAAVELEVPENTASKTAVGEAITAIDPESDSLTYSLVGADSHWFDLDTSNGQIKTKALLDHESPQDADNDNVYEFRVWVTDGEDSEGNEDSSVDDSIDVTITVTNVNEPPAFGSAAIGLEIDENSASGTDVGSPITATDPETDALTYSLAGADAIWFDIDESNGQITTKAVLDHEAPEDSAGDNVYAVVLQVSDGKDQDGGTDPTVDATVNVSITVTDLNEPPGFESESIDLFAGENTAGGTNIGGPVAAIDPDSDALTYFLSGVDSGLFEIESSTGQISAGSTAAFDTEPPSDADADNVYELIVQVMDARDAEGNPDNLVDGQITVKINVMEINEPPKFDSPAVELEIAENHLPEANVGNPVVAIDPESAVLTYTLSGVDSGLFLVNVTSGQVSVGAGTALDFESPLDSGGDNLYELFVEVTDGHDESGRVDASADATIPVTIAVMDVNEAPEFDGLYVWFEVEENTALGTAVGDPIVATDPETGELRYLLAGDDAELFDFDPLTGLIRVAAGTALDYESPSDGNGDNVYESVVQVSDGRNEVWEVDPSIDDEIGVIITVLNVEEAGEGTSPTVQLAVQENAPAGTKVGVPMTVEAIGSADLTYSLHGVDAYLFDIDASSGQLAVRVEFDYEFPVDIDLDNDYEFAVRATDGLDSDGNADSSVDDEIDVVVRVFNINETPVATVAIPDRTLIESVVVDQFDVSDFFSDPDGDELSYAATSSDSQVAVVVISDATLAAYAAGAGTVTIEVTATDPGQLRSSQRFVVTVVSERPAPIGPIPIFPPVHQEAGGATGAGPDLANLLSDADAVVVPRTLSLAPGQVVSMHAIAFNSLGDALPVGMPGVVCSWWSDGGGAFSPNGSESACTTTYTAPDSGSGTIVVRVTQGRMAASGSAVFGVVSREATATGPGREVAPGFEFPEGVTGSIVWRGDGATVISPNGFTLEVPADAIHADVLGAFIREMSPQNIDLPENSRFTVGSHAAGFVFTDDTGVPMPGFRTNAPVRICLPITREDLETAANGIDGIYLVHLLPDGRFVRHASDSDSTRMVTCADVDHFSTYFVGLDVEGPAQTAKLTPTASPIPAPAPTPSPAPTSTPTPSPTLVPSPGLTPSLPSAGDSAPGPWALFLIALAAVAAVATGGALLRGIRPVTPCR